MTVEAKGRMTLLVNDYRKNPLLDAWTSVGQIMNVTKPIKASGTYWLDDVCDDFLRPQIVFKNGEPTLVLIENGLEIGTPKMRELKWIENATRLEAKGFWTDPTTGCEVLFSTSIVKKKA